MHLFTYPLLGPTHCMVIAIMLQTLLLGTGPSVLLMCLSVKWNSQLSQIDFEMSQTEHEYPNLDVFLPL